MLKTTVLVIDDEVFFRAGVCRILSLENDLRILECGPADHPLEVIEASLPDVVLLGSNLAAHSGLELGRKIARHYPNTRVIMLSPNPDDKELFEVIKTSAVACLSKNVAATELVGIIRRAVRGEYPINDSLMSNPRLARQVLDQFRDIPAIDNPNIMTPLTRREIQILRYIADGNSNRKIAASIGISEQTIKSHVSAILRKLNANHRAHAVALAISNNWISREDEPKKFHQAVTY